MIDGTSAPAFVFLVAWNAALIIGVLWPLICGVLALVWYAVAAGRRAARRSGG
jgi:hypothetical protein